MIPSWYPTAEVPLLGTFYKEQAEALAARGVDVAVAYVNVTGDLHPGVHGIRCEKINGVPTYRYTHPNWTPRLESGRCWQRTRMLRRLYKRIDREWGRPDVVNLRSSLQGYEVMELCRRENLPLFFMEHSSYVITEPEDGLIRKRLREVMAAAAVNACVSSAVRRVMEPYGETRVIPDIVDGERFHPLEFPRDYDGFLFRAMGQLRPIKGYDVLIDAFIRLKGRRCGRAAGRTAAADRRGRRWGMLPLGGNHSPRQGCGVYERLRLLCLFFPDGNAFLRPQRKRRLR